MPRTFVARITLLLVLTGLAVVAVEAQQIPRQRSDTPLAQGVVPLSEVEVLETPPVDLPAFQAEDLTRESTGLPPRFAAPFVVDETPNNSGLWEASNDGRRVWRLRVASPGAVSISLGFTQYVMPPGGRLFLYTPDYEEIVGPFTDLDNETHRELWTPLLSGDEVVIEVSLPGDRSDDLVLEVGSVNRGYRTFTDLNKSGSCNVDVLCSQGDAWRPQIRAVGAYTRDGSFFCTGAMINNTSGDRKPYFLTANHCGVSSGNAASVVVYWNFVNSVCRTPGGTASGQPGDGSLTQFQTGAFFRASYDLTDFTLIELDEAPNANHAVFWAGWDRSGADAASATAIHHPSGDEKRISFENNPTTVTSLGGTSVPGNATHVRVADWDLGTTETGSSGSPLFDQNRRIIGQLQGGAAACGNDQSDWYGRLASSWTGGSTASSRLSNWLDPGNTGAITIDGREDISFTDHPLTAGTFVQLIHIIELRNAINDARAAKSLGPFSFTDPTLTAQSTPIKAIHITELRTALEQAYSAAKQTPPTYTDPTITAGTTVVKAVHISEIRTAVANLP